jgi:dihydrofolate reductase
VSAFKPSEKRKELSKMLNLSMIAAVGKNLELGKNNQLLCHLPADLKQFKDITSCYPVIMGDNTWESLPIKPLPNRKNIVITLNNNANYTDCEIVHALDDAVKLVENEEKAFIIGGATIYKLFIDRIDTLYLTQIDANFDADVFFPNVDFSKWKMIEDESYEKDEKNGYSMRFQVFERHKKLDS